jgi:hypothetical protein
VPLLLAALVAGCGGPSAIGSGASPAANPSAEAISAAPPSPATPTPTPTATPTATVDPGTLPQTHVLPGTDDPMFQAGVQALWRAIVNDDPSAALSFFFPRTAYVQVKAIQNPVADYQSRLIGLYRLDIHAAHQLLGPGPDAVGARLVSVAVPTSQAQWIVPGVESNKGSYYRVYGTRLTYQVAGRTKSFGIFSLISWRGEWYVVHLGPSARSGFHGAVYQPTG